MCGGKGGTSTGSSSVSIPSNVLASYNQVYGQAQQAASQPFQQYSGEFVAPVTGTEQLGINEISGAGNYIQPTYDQSTGLVNAGLSSASPQYSAASGLYGGAAGLAAAGTGQVNAQPLNIAQYMSPYQSSVVDATTAWLNQQNQQQQTNLTSNAISSGAFGGDRSGIASGVLSGQQNLANASTIAGLNNQNYAQALAAAQQQQGVNLGAGQANRTALQTGSGLLSSAAAGETGLGQTQFNTGLAAGNAYNTFGNQAFGNTLAGGQATLGAGLVPQQTQQAQDTALYNQFLMQQAYPFQTTQFMANLAEGVGPLQGSTTSQTSFQPQPFFSDDKLKENVRKIGETKDGLHIIRYNYKDDPHKLLRIGFLASDVEKKMPEAVQKHNGLRSVDYERAARASGGIANDESMGGAVEPGTGMRVAFAPGGSMPGYDPAVMAAIAAAQQAMYPGAAGRAGIGGTGPRGMQLSEGHHSELLKAPLPQQKQQTPELAQDLKAANELSSVGKGASDLYSEGKDALVGSAGKGTVGSSGYVAPTGGLIGSGGSADWNAGWLGRNTAGLAPAANSNSITSTALAAPPAFDATDSGGWGYAGGGRLKRAVGGGGMGGTIPYDDSGGYVPAADYAPFSRTPAGEERAMAGKSGSGGGGGSSSGLLGSLNSLVSLGKTGAGLFGGSGGAVGADGLPLSGLGASTGDAAAGAAGAFGAADAGAGAAGAAGAGGGADALMGLFALAKRGGRIGKDDGGSVHDNTWLEYPGEAIGAGVGGFYGGPGGAIAGGEGGKTAGLAVGDAIGGNWSGVGSDILSSVAGGLKQSLQGLQGPMGMMGGGGGSGSPLSMLGLRRGGRAGYEDGGSPDDDTQIAEAPPPTNAGLAMPQRDNVVPFRNPERPGSRERGEERHAEAYKPEDIDTGGTGRYVDPRPEPAPTTAGVVPPAATSMPGPLPGVASSVTAPPASTQNVPAVSSNGVNRNNIGNVRPYDGSGGFQQPPDFNSGVGLTVHNVQQYPDRYNGGKPMTLEQIGSRWAPKGDGANDPAQWARNVAANSGLPVDQPLDLKDPKVAAAFARGVHGAEHGASALQPVDAYLPGVDMANDPNVIRGFPGAGGGSNRAVALNAGVAPSGGGIGGALSSAGDWIGNAASKTGDWLDRNEKYVIPALSFLGNMLASPSRTLAGAVGTGIAAGAKALPQQQELGQGQQRIDITQRSQQMSLWAQMRQMWAASVTAANPGGDPALKAQMDRLAVQIAQGGGGPVGSAPAGGPNSPAGGAPTNLAPTATPPTNAGVAPAPAPAAPPISASPLPPPVMPTPVPVAPSSSTAGAPPAGTPTVQPENEASLLSVQRPKPEYTPEFLSQLAPNANPVALREQARVLTAAGNPLGQQKYKEADDVEKQIQATGQGVGANGPVTAPNAEALQQSQNRVKENAEWQRTQAPVAQQRQITRDNLQHVVKTLETFEPGAFAKVKADLAAYAGGATGIKPPTTSTMNAAEYEKFLKAMAAVQSSAVGVDHGTDMARATLNAALAHPEQQPEAVRANLATALGQLDYSEELYKDHIDKMQRYPWLNQGLRLGEFTARHPVEKYVSDHEANMAVRGATPDKPDELKPGQAYIVEPSQAKAWHLPGIEKPTKLRFKGVEPDGRVRFGRIQ